MALIVYNTTTGAIYSQNSASITVAQAQAIGSLPDNATLAGLGLAAIDGQPVLGSSAGNNLVYVWNATTKSVTTGPNTAPNWIPTYSFILLFTPAEHAAIQASTDAKVTQFMMAVSVTPQINLNDPIVINGINYLVSISLLTQPNANLILSGQPSQ